MAKKRKCKTCGRMYEAKQAGDRYCSELCRTAGLFIGGGGDTEKPRTTSSGKLIVAAPKVENENVQKPSHKQKPSGERFERVRAMFDLPPEERWAIAKNFTKEEQEYARRIARRMIAEDIRIEHEWSWEENEGEGEVVREIGMSGGMLGESDDGSI